LCVEKHNFFVKTIPEKSKRKKKVNISVESIFLEVSSSITFDKRLMKGE